MVTHEIRLSIRVYGDGLEASLCVIPGQSGADVAMTLPPPSPEAIAALRAGASRAHRLQAASWVQLHEKTRLGLDAPPGVGWRLEMSGRGPRYYASREQAVIAWKGDGASHDCRLPMTIGMQQ